MMKHQRAIVEMINRHVEIKRPFHVVEVGCYRGATSKVLIDAFPSIQLSMVDMWKEWSPDEPFWNTGMGKKTQAEWDEIEQAARAAVLGDAVMLGAVDVRHVVRGATIHKMPSVEAAELFDDESLSVVYIDAGYEYKDVVSDITAWLPKVRVGGLISGHDYGGRYKGVAKAVHGCFVGDEIILNLHARTWGHVVR